MSDEYTAHTEDDGSVVFGEGYTPKNAKPEPVKADHWWEKVLTIEVRKAIYTAMAAIVPTFGGAVEGKRHVIAHKSFLMAAAMVDAYERREWAR